MLNPVQRDAAFAERSRRLESGHPRPMAQPPWAKEPTVSHSTKRRYGLFYTDIGETLAVEDIHDHTCTDTTTRRLALYEVVKTICRSFAVGIISSFFFFSQTEGKSVTKVLYDYVRRAYR